MGAGVEVARKKEEESWRKVAVVVMSSWASIHGPGPLSRSKSVYHIWVDRACRREH